MYKLEIYPNFMSARVLHKYQPEIDQNFVPDQPLIARANDKPRVTKCICLYLFKGVQVHLHIFAILQRGIVASLNNETIPESNLF